MLDATATAVGARSADGWDRIEAGVVLVTDEDVERGHLENGWIVVVGRSQGFVDPPSGKTTRPLRSWSGWLQVHKERVRGDVEAWVIETTGERYANRFMQVVRKMRVAAEDEELELADVEALVPGMVMVVSGDCGQSVWMYRGDDKLCQVGICVPEWHYSPIVGDPRFRLVMKRSTRGLLK